MSRLWSLTKLAQFLIEGVLQDVLVDITRGASPVIRAIKLTPPRPRACAFQSRKAPTALLIQNRSHLLAPLPALAPNHAAKLP
jgi:hypothetical protein